MFGILIETDPGNSLGGSCLRDLWNTASYLKKTYSNMSIHVFSNKKIKDGHKQNFPNGCKFHIISGLKNQVNNIMKIIKKGSTLFVLFSGHGYQRRDTNNDELDGRDEYVRTNDGVLSDDDIHNMFLSRSDIKVMALCDACHSGSLFDLPYSWNGSSWIKASKNDKHKSSCEVIVIGACQDNQLEACDITDKIGYGGALVVHMLENDYLKVLLDGDMKEIKKVYNHMVKILSAFGQKPVLQSNMKY